MAGLSGRLSADIALVVCHQPYTDAAGSPYYSAAEVVAAIGGLAQEVNFVPIGRIVRKGFERSGWSQHLAEFDWPNVFDFGPATTSNASLATTGLSLAMSCLRSAGTAGRTGQMADTKAEISLNYQNPGRGAAFGSWAGVLTVRHFSMATCLQLGGVEFNAVEPERFLRTIDAFVSYHHSNWVEGFGRTVLEAIASGVPCVLPPSFIETFEGAALYAAPENVTLFLQRLDDRRPELKAWAKFAHRLVQGSFGPQRIIEIYEALSHSAPARPKSSPRRNGS